MKECDFWTEVRIAEFKRLYNIMSERLMAQHFGIREGAVVSMAYVLELNEPEILPEEIPVPEPPKRKRGRKPKGTAPVIVRLPDTSYAARVTKIIPTLKGFAVSMVKNTDRAEDLLQQTALRALKCEDRFQEGTNLKAWLYTMMKNIFINEYRRNQKVKMRELTYREGPAFQAQNEGKSSVEVDMIMKEVNALCEEFRVPFMMYYQGFKYHEIADHLTLPIGTVKSRIHFARKELKKKLKRA